LNSVPADLTTFDPTICNGDLGNTEDFTHDLAVLNGPVLSNAVAGVSTDLLDPLFSLLMTGVDVARPGTNTFITGSAGFVNEYLNASRDNFLFPEFKTLQTAGAFDEGGNFIQVAFGPLSLLELDSNPNNAEGAPFDYHITPASLANGNGGGTGGRLSLDIDNDPRATGVGSDIGADEL
jgi:hypothetical protein